MDRMLRAYGLDDPFPSRWTEPDGQDILQQPQDTKTGGESLLFDQLMASLGGESAAVAVDERDPLGTTDSVREALVAQGVAVDGVDSNNERVRARFMLSSPQFQPRLFLRTLHANASYEDLCRGLRHLESSIATRDGDIRTMVDDDYEHFVSTKRRLDEVMARMQQPNAAIGALSRGVDDANARLALCTRPLDVLGAQTMRFTAASQALDRHRAVFELPGIMRKYAQAHDHDSFIRVWTSGKEGLKQLVMEADAVQSSRGSNGNGGASGGSSRGSDIVAAMTQRISALIEYEVEAYRSQLWAEVMETSAGGAYASLLLKLVEAGVRKNPALKWMQKRVATFNNRITYLFEELRTITSRDEFRTPELGPWLGSLTAVNNLEDVDSDSPDIIAEWNDITNVFERLCATLADACLFWRERASLRGPLGLTPQQDARITAQCSDLVELASRELAAACVPSDGARIAVLPQAANALSTSKYLVRIESILSDAVYEVAQLLGPQNAFASAVSASRQQFAKSLAETWLRDSTTFGVAAHNWHLAESRVAVERVSDLFEAFHLILLDGVRKLSTPSASTQKRVGGFLGAALSLSLQNIYASLVDSERMSLSQNSQLRPRGMDQDTKVLVTLANLDRIGSKALPRIYTQFERSIRGDSATVAGVTQPALDELVMGLFGLYTQKKRARLSAVARDEIQRLKPAWSQSGGDPPSSISPYILESLLVLVGVHASFQELCPQKAREALTVLHHHWLQAVLDGLREFDALGRHGTLQAVADLEFVRSTMTRLRTPESHTLEQRIFDTIKSASLDSSLWKGADAPRDRVRTVIESALTNEGFAFLCFKA